MTKKEAAERARVVAAAALWLGTKWKHRANVLGEGIDCAHHLLETGVRSGMVERFDPSFYTRDWHWHRDEERFLDAVREHAPEIGEGEASIRERGCDFSVLSGNVILWKNGRTFSHGGIVSEWPMVIHASWPARSCIEESVYGGILETSPVRIFSYWGR